MIKKLSLFILTIFLTFSLAIAYTPISRVRNFVNDASNGIPITASYMDAEFNNIIAAANGTLIVQGSAPSSPYNGEYWWNTTGNTLEHYRNNEWVVDNLVQGGSNYPAYPVLGDIHVNWPDLNASSSGINWANLSVFNGNIWLPVNNPNPSFNTIMTTGNVGIGTTSLQQALTVMGNVGIGTVTSTGGALIIQGGNVGIGSLFPGTSLDVNGTVRAIGFYPYHATVFIQSSLTWTAPGGINNILLSLCGGGGGGQSGISGGSTGGDGAAGAGCLSNFPLAVIPGNGYAIGIGTYGVGGVGTTGVAGSDGVATTFAGDNYTITANLGRGSANKTTPGTVVFSAQLGTPYTGTIGGNGIAHSGSSGGNGGYSFIAAGGVGSDSGSNNGGNGICGSGGGGGFGTGGGNATNGGNGGPGCAIITF